MIKYDISDLNIQEITNIEFVKLFFKQQHTQIITPIKQINIYSSDQISSVVSKITLSINLPMENASMVFVQGTRYLVPFNYTLNNFQFKNQSIFDITINYNKQQNIDQPRQNKPQQPQQQIVKEIGPIPINASEILFLDRYKDEIDSLTPQISIRQDSISDVFDIAQKIQVFILDLKDIIQELNKHNLILKSSIYMNYFKYLFKYKYFPYSENQSLLIKPQFQLKQNQIQQDLVERSEQIFQNLEFKFAIQKVFLKYNIPNKQVDIQQLFDSVHILEQQDIKYIQYLYIIDEKRFYAQKSYRDQIEPYKQFYEDVIILGMQSEVICEINTSGQISMSYDVLKTNINISQNAQKQQNTIQLSKNFMLEQLKILLEIFETRFLQSKSLDSSYFNETSEQKITDQSNLAYKQVQYDQIQFNMISRVSVNGIMITNQQLVAVIQENPEIFQLREGTESQILTNLFLNQQSTIRLVDSSKDETTFEVESTCTNYVKQLIPSILIFILKNQKETSTLDDSHQSRGYHRLKNNDQFLFEGILENENYSRLCKKHQQPNPVSEQHKNDKGVTQYYNFTQKRQQYYQCPPQYQHLGFIVNKHTKDYCLPCCYSVPQTFTKKKKIVTEQCLTSHKYSQSPKEQSDVNTYIFTNPNKLVISRNTVLHESIQQLLSPDKQENQDFAWFIFTLQVPDYISSEKQKIASIIESCCYLLSITHESMIKNIDIFVKQYPHFIQQWQFFNQSQELLLNISLFEFLFYQFIDHQYKINLLILHDNRVPFQGSRAIQEGNSQLVCFGIQRDYSIIIIRKKDIYNPIIYGECKEGKIIQNVDHIQKRYMKIPSKYILKLKSSIELQQKQKPHNLQKIVEKLHQSNDFKFRHINTQIINKQGYVQYIDAAIDFKSIQYNMLLPVSPSIQLQEEIQTSFEFSKTQGFNSSAKLLFLIIESIYKCNPQQRIIDNKTNTLQGFLYNNLFFYSEQYPNEVYQNLPIHQLIKFNPLELNQGIILKQFTKLNQHVISVSLRFAYFTNIYKLMKLQYAYYTNFQSNEIKDWDDIFVFQDINQIYNQIEKISKLQLHQIQELVKMRVCSASEEKQFFCQGNKLIIPLQFKSYIDLLKKDIKRDLSLRYLQVYQIMLQQFIFQEREGDHLQTGVIDKSS